MPEVEVIAKTHDGPVRRTRLQADLQNLDVTSGMTLIVHSSLSSLGWVVGAQQTVLDAVEEVLGPTGSLVMPAHSNGVPEPERWVDPPVPKEWWPIIRQDWPPFDPRTTPCSRLGVLPELFRTQPGTLRSGHPNLSFTARGPNAARIVTDQTLDFGMGESSPLARLYELDASILLLGVDHGSNTSLHLAEYRADWPGRRQVLGWSGRIVKDGSIVPVSFQDIAGTSDDFAQLGRDYERETDNVQVGKAGEGTARLMRMRPIVDYAVTWIEKHRTG
ncbi:MAG: aminoglycoside N(3)-acetyltransferase [Thermoplasmata archaeon]